MHAGIFGHRRTAVTPVASTLVSALAAMSVTELRDHVEADPSGVRDEAHAAPGVATDCSRRAGARCSGRSGSPSESSADSRSPRPRLRAGVDLADEAGRTGACRRTEDDASPWSSAGSATSTARWTLLDAAEPLLRGAERARAIQNRGMVQYWRGDFAVAAATLESACRALRAPRRPHRRGPDAGHARCRARTGARLPGVPSGTSSRRSTSPRDSARSLLVAVGAPQPRLPRDAAARSAASDRRVRDRRGGLRRRGGADGYLPQVHADHAQVLADAALFDDADALLRRALDMLRADGNEIEMAGALVTAAEIRLAQRDPAGARVGRRRSGRAGTASRDATGWVAVATEPGAAGRGAGGASRRPSWPINSTTSPSRLDEGGLGSRSAPLATRRLARPRRARRCRSDDPVSADTRRRVARGPAGDRILLAHVDAIAAERRGDRAAARRAISRGLDVAMSSQAALGSIETAGARGRPRERADRDRGSDRDRRRQAP